MARITVVQAGRTKNQNIGLSLPNGETRKLKPGPSAVITKQVVEVFAERFFEQPALIWVSESGKKVFESDDKLAKSLNLEIDVARNLPVTETRRERLLERSQSAGISESQTAFVTAYLARNEPSLKRNFADLAWNSFIWIASEPENIIAMYAGGMHPPRLHALLQSRRHIRRVK